jgi:hypothetical protein
MITLQQYINSICYKRTHASPPKSIDEYITTPTLELYFGGMPSSGTSWGSQTPQQAPLLLLSYVSFMLITLVSTDLCSSAFSRNTDHSSTFAGINCELQTYQINIIPSDLRDNLHIAIRYTISLKVIAHLRAKFHWLICSPYS